MSALARFPSVLEKIDTYVFFEDFISDQADTVMVDTITDTGTVLMGDAVGGVAVLTPSDGTVGDNDEAYLGTPNEVFKVAAGKPMGGECSLQFAEANTDDANVAFGFMNAANAVNSITDNGAGPKVSGSTFVIYKVDGGTVWKAASYVNGSGQVSTSTKTAGGSAYQRLSIEIVEDTSTHGRAIYKVDGQPLIDSTSGLPIVHRFAYASATEMNLFVGVKNGDTNLETLSVDWICGFQKR